MNPALATLSTMMKRLTLGGLLLSTALCFGAPRTAVAGLDEPPPAGSKVLYMFTGARSILGASGTAATSIHCSSFATVATTVHVQWFSGGGALQASLQTILNFGESKTFSTRDTEFYAEISSSLNLTNGSARVLAEGSANVICTAQVLDPIGDPPSYIVALPGFGKNGKLR